MACPPLGAGMRRVSPSEVSMTSWLTVIRRPIAPVFCSCSTFCSRPGMSPPASSLLVGRSIRTCCPVGSWWASSRSAIRGGRSASGRARARSSWPVSAPWVRSRTVTSLSERFLPSPVTCSLRYRRFTVVSPLMPVMVTGSLVRAWLSMSVAATTSPGRRSSMVTVNRAEP
ncbi:hypothetical protein ACFFX0_25790 [Citricoccus parietis]|uniref:Uncharacterized protein n=1 Tax=Citricoccus parietis TaxID=592307 RepID=A0ABV5G638_9MICC